MTEIKKLNLDEEPERQDKLVKDNQEIRDLSEVIDEHVAIKEKIQNGEWLDEQELEALELSPDAIKDYLETRELILSEESKTGDDISAEYLAKQNEQIEVQNKEIEARQKDKMLTQKINELADGITSYVALARNRGKGRWGVEKIITELAPSKEFQQNFNIDLSFPGAIAMGDFQKLAPQSLIARRIKKALLDSSLSTDQMLREIPKFQIKIMELVDDINELEQKEQDVEERAKRIKADESMLGKIRKYLKGDSNKEE